MPTPRTVFAPSTFFAWLTRATLMLSAVVGNSAGLAAPADKAVDTALQHWRSEYAASLAEPDGWLSLVALQWLAEGATTIGSGTGNKLQLQHLPPHGLTLQQHNGSASLAGSSFDPCLRVNGAPAHAQPLATDETGHPSVLTCGGVQMTVIHRGDKLYLRVKDSDAPTRTHFTGLHWFAPNPSARIVAKWVPYPTPHTLRITNVLGQVSEERTAGYAEFTYDGKPARLEPLVEGDSLFFIFRDETRTGETYPAGRFLSTALPDHGPNQPGTVVLDFNQAHNPPCAYTPYATCPLPPQQNRLALRIPAGERRFHN